MGYTTSLFAKNSSYDTKIVSIDLPPGKFLDNPHKISGKILTNDWKKNDNFLRQAQNDAGEIYLNGIDACDLSKITLIKEDSTRLSSSAKAQIANADLVFIDGGHSFDDIQSDTLTATDVISPLGIIAWHDYSSGIHHEVTQYIDNFLATEKLLFHVHGTMLVLFLGHVKSLLHRNA